MKLLSAENNELKLHERELKTAIEIWREKYTNFETESSLNINFSVY